MHSMSLLIFLSFLLCESGNSGDETPVAPHPSLLLHPKPSFLESGSILMR